MEDRQNQLLPLSTQCSHFDYDFQRSQQDKVCTSVGFYFRTRQLTISLFPSLS